MSAAAVAAAAIAMLSRVFQWLRTDRSIERATDRPTDRTDGSLVRMKQNDTVHQTTCPQPSIVNVFALTQSADGWMDGRTDARTVGYRKETFR